MTVDLGQALLQARTAQGRALQAIGVEAKISPAYLQKLEAGRVGSPNPRVLARLGSVLGVAYGELMALANYLPVPDDAAGTELPKPTAGGTAVATNRELLRVLQEIEARLAQLELAQERIATDVQSLLAR